MKTLKSVIIGVALLAVCTVANAAKPATVPLSKEDAINIYVNAVTKGELTGIEDVLDPNVTFTTIVHDEPVNVTREAVIKDLKANEGVKQDCSTATSIIGDSPRKAVVRVEMKYNNSVRTNYVTLVSTRKGWKITEVSSVFS